MGQRQIIIKNKNIALIGMPGCGKTTVGKVLSKKLDLQFIDVDHYIEKNEGKTINEIFKNGEDFFRNIETRAIEKICRKFPMVISTGGGVVKNPENIKILKKNSIIIFINRPIEDIIKNINTSVRPLLSGNLSRIYELHEERYPLYKKYCHYEVLNDKNIVNTVNKILKILDNNF